MWPLPHENSEFVGLEDVRKRLARKVSERMGCMLPRDVDAPGGPNSKEPFIRKAAPELKDIRFRIEEHGCRRRDLTLGGYPIVEISTVQFRIIKY